MSRACVCGGSNENCCFCNGLGTISDRLATALNVHAGRPESDIMPRGSGKGGRRRKASRSPAKLIPCPRGCGAMLGPSDLARHYSDIHGVGPDVHQQEVNSGPNCPTNLRADRKYEPCQVCNATIRSERMQRHLSNVHRFYFVRTAKAPKLGTGPNAVEQTANRKNATEAPKTTGEYPPISNLDRPCDGARQQTESSSPIRPESPKHALRYEHCPVCKVKVKTGRIQKHIAKVHTPSRVHPTEVVIQSANDVQRKSTSLIAPRDKNLDATRLYAHSYRERGRFGSHPSHDGFDDESGPDEGR